MRCNPWSPGCAPRCARPAWATRRSSRIRRATGWRWRRTGSTRWRSRPRRGTAAGRGPALADVSATRFASGPAARLEELRSGAALDLVEAGLALGESDSLVGELRAMIAADPVAERPRGLLMRALYAAGRQTEALAEYNQARELFATELGVDPSPQLEQIYLGVLRQDLPDGTRSQPSPDAGTATGPADFFAERMVPGNPPPTAR